jgi:hypothetical protein
LVTDGDWNGTRDEDSRILTFTITNDLLTDFVLSDGSQDPEPTETTNNYRPKTMSLRVPSPSPTDPFSFMYLGLKRDGEMLQTVGEMNDHISGGYLYHSGDTGSGLPYNDLYPFAYGRQYSYELLAKTARDDDPNGSAYTLALARFIPAKVDASQNQAVDSRVDAREKVLDHLDNGNPVWMLDYYDSDGNPVWVHPFANYRFGASLYRGGLFVGATKSPVDSEKVDPSRIGRSLIQFRFPWEYSGGAWQVGSVNAYRTNTLDRGPWDDATPGMDGIRIRCVPVHCGPWSAASLDWTGAWNLTGGANLHPAQGVTAANTLPLRDSSDPIAQRRWYRWGLGEEMAPSVNGGYLTVVLASASEDPDYIPDYRRINSAYDNTGWVYFAKKEFFPIGGRGEFTPYLLCAYVW